MGEAKIRKQLGLTREQLNAIDSLSKVGEKIVVQEPSRHQESGDKPDKGLKNGSCNRRGCQKPGATWFNKGTRAYYCESCAEKINGFNRMGFSEPNAICVREKPDLPYNGEVFLCIRVYPNGEAKYTVRDKEGKDSWVEYNSQFRGGNTLFVNAEYIPGTGSLGPKYVEFITKYLQYKHAEDIKGEVPLKLGDHDEYLGGRFHETRHGYPDDFIYPTIHLPENL